MSKKLETLQNSLAKKEILFSEKLKAHFNTVALANGQPMNDKRNGKATLNKWDKQETALKNLEASIKLTKDAIQKEIGAIGLIELANDTLPPIILELVTGGELTQWAKYPNTFFVVGVEKARIYRDKEKKQVFAKYVKSITDKDQYRKFALTFNVLVKALNLKSE